MLRKSSLSLVLALGLWLMCIPTHANIDGPDTYVYVEVSLREVTIEGMRQRLALLQGSNYSVAADDAIDAETRVRVADVYARFGTSVGAHMAYGTRHASLIETWLNENPTWKGRYASLDSQFRSLSEQLNASRRPQ